MPNRGGPPWLDALFAFAFIFLLGFGFFGWFCCYMLLAALARLFGSRRLARALGAHLISTVCVLFFGGLGELHGLGRDRRGSPQATGWSGASCCLFGSRWASG